MTDILIIRHTDGVNMREMSLLLREMSLGSHVMGLEGVKWSNEWDETSWGQNQFDGDSDRLWKDHECSE